MEELCWKQQTGLYKEGCVCVHACMCVCICDGGGGGGGTGEGGREEDVGYKAAI